VCVHARQRGAIQARRTSEEGLAILLGGRTDVAAFRIDDDGDTGVATECDGGL
jgi:hypothetical protein